NVNAIKGMSNAGVLNNFGASASPNICAGITSCSLGTFLLRINNVDTNTIKNIKIAPINRPIKLYLISKTEPIKGPKRNPKLNIERIDVYANVLKLELLFFASFTLSRADAYNCGMAGAPKL